MKKLVLATAFTFAATAGFAGGYEEPIIEPVIIEEETGTSTGVWIPLAIFAVIAAAAASCH